LRYSSKTTHIFLVSSYIYSHIVLQRFEAIIEEALLSLIYSSQEVCIVPKRHHQPRSWYSTWRGFWKPRYSSLYRMLEASSPKTLLYYMYSRSAPFCMRSEIIINKIRSEVFVAISCAIFLASC
jgi:hypothetical protein